MAEGTLAGLTEVEILNAVERLTKPGRDAHQNRTRSFNQSYDVWRASPPRNQVERWRSKLRVKYAMQTTDTALVNIVSGTPRCTVRARHPDDADGAQAMQQLFDYFVAEDHLAESQVIFAQQGLIYGVTAAKNHWVYREGARTARTFAPDEFGRMMPGDPQTQQTVLRDGPCFEPWDIYGCWWDPNARDVDSAGYVVLESWLTADELRKRRKNPETGIGYDNVDVLLKAGPSGRRPDSAQDTYLGGAAEKRKGCYRIREIWRDDVLVVLGGDNVLLQVMANPYWHGRKPIVIAQTRPDLFEMAGIPEVELMADIQEAAWTLQNMTIDALKLTIQRGVTYREGSVVDPNMLDMRPNFRWGVGDHEDIRAFEFPPISSDVYQERTRLLSDMQLVTGITPYVSGADSTGVDQTTATGIAALQGAASALLRFKAAQIHFKGFQRTFEMWGDMIQQFLDRNVWVQITGPQGEKTWAEVTPAQVNGHFHYRLEGSEENMTRQNERAEASAIWTALMPAIQAGIINPEPLAERLAAAYNIADPKALIRQPQQLPPAAPNGMPGQQGPGPQPLLNGQQMPPGVQQAITAGR